jgi:uncharacterized damage-inducible protein DinB
VVHDGEGTHDAAMTAQHRADQFVDPATDPREGGPTMQDEKTTLQEYLRFHRLTLELKCADLDAEQLARRSVPPSTMSLLGLVRHMAEVERVWFRRRLDRNDDVGKLYQTEEDPDADFNGAVADPAVVDDAWARWREEVAFAEQWVEGHDDLGGLTCATRGGEASYREVLVHMVEEYARHNGHADLLRECVDGRVGQ